MKVFSGIKRYELYVWLAPAFLFLNVLGDIIAHKSDLPQRAVNEIWLACYVTVMNYRLLEHTLPVISLKRFFRSFLLILPYLFAYSLGLYLWRAFGIGLHIYTILNNKLSIDERIGELTGYSIGSVLFFSIVRHIFNYIKLKQSTRDLLIASQQAELNYLRSQTNPHFLFNTLNNIYSLARDKSDLAPESILRLSKILRYMLYETSAPYAAIEQEIKIIDDYIELEKLRYHELHVNFNHDLEDRKQALPPLLLIPLVENAFKHGVSETRDRPSVTIHLSVKNRILLFIVENSTGEPAGDANLKENIGLSNLRRQLALLYTNYSLDIRPGDFTFTATLKINLDSHV